MLVARRDPPLNGDYEHPRGHGYFHGHGHHSSRFMTAVQILGTLVGIPVGLASVYSIYHSNFTVEARCETLRGGIISMLDKSADASTLRMLVRRDVVTFETNCASVDPDAVKAFKALLAEKTPAAAPVARTAPATTPAPKAQQQAAREVHPPVEPAKQAAPAKPVPPETKAVEAKAVEAKPVETKPVETKPVETKSVETKPVHRDAETSDAKWVSSVRDALVHAPAHDDAAVAPAPAPVAAPVAQPLPPPPAPPMPTEAAREPAPTPPRAVVESPASTPPAAPQARLEHDAPPVSLAPPAAPALPDPVPVAAAPMPKPAADHPVPPGSIPDALAEAKPTDQPDDKSGHSWMANIPILNRVVGH